MRFGTCQASEGLGHILAHTVGSGGKKVKKGKITDNALIKVIDDADPRFTASLVN